MPDSSNNPNTCVGAMAPDAYTSPVEWGPEIRVDGKRPEWLDDSDRFKLRECGNPFYDNLFSAPEVDWHEEVEAIRLPADHPHYSKAPTTPELDPALWDRMVALVRSVAQYVPEAFTEVREARAIVADLPKPVDPDLIEARECAAQAQLASVGEATRAGGMDDQPIVRAALAAIKRGRELAGEQA